MNYIQHLNTVFEKFYRDERLHTSHISLYMALFHYWNLRHFAPSFHIRRGEVIKLSAIGSKSTYHRCIRDLHRWNYLRYVPSKNSHLGSQVSLWDFSSGSVPQLGQCTPRASHPIGLGSSIMGQEYPIDSIYNKTKKQSNTQEKIDSPTFEQEILSYFEKHHGSLGEGQKFFNHYRSTGWKTGNGTTIVNWKAAAEKWMLKADEIKKNQQGNHPDYLKTKKSKDYAQPL